MMVRAAVLKMKDPRQIIRDMEKLDEMGMDQLVCVTAEAALSQICLYIKTLPILAKGYNIISKGGSYFLFSLNVLNRIQPSSAALVE